MSPEAYKAKDRYQNTAVAHQYEDQRFKTWWGKKAHQNEEKALIWAVTRYFKAPASVLDIPCGTGRLLPALTSRGFRIVGGDVSDEMLAVAKNKMSQFPNISFERMDAEKIPHPDNAFDYLTSYRLMCHLPLETARRVLSEMIRVTRKILVINYHFATSAPLYQINRLFRQKSVPAFPLDGKKFIGEINSKKDVRLLEVKKLNWYERSSSLVVLEKKGN